MRATLTYSQLAGARPKHARSHFLLLGRTLSRGARMAVHSNRSYENRSLRSHSKGRCPLDVSTSFVNEEVCAARLQESSFRMKSVLADVLVPLGDVARGGRRGKGAPGIRGPEVAGDGFA